MELLKRIWVVVKPFKARDVVEALAPFDSVRDVVVSECRGYGRQKGHLELAQTYMHCRLACFGGPTCWT